MNVATLAGCDEESSDQPANQPDIDFSLAALKNVNPAQEAATSMPAGALTRQLRHENAWSQ